VSLEPAQSSRAVVDRLQQTVHQSVAPFNPGSAPFALVDFPDHSNVGDSAIWLGEIAAFRDVWGTRPSYVCNFQNFDSASLERHVPDGPIFVHGGGNFGDIWMDHQRFREDLLRRYPGRPIVQLPQSIHYDDVAHARETAKLIQNHGAFTLMVRDVQSFAFAKENFSCPVHLVPDMAFALGSIPRPQEAKVETLMLLRTDKEILGSRGTTDEASDGAVNVDWLVDDPYLYLKARLMGWSDAVALSALFQGQSLQRRAAARSEYLAHVRVQRGLNLLASGRRVITDRLHGHILSTLMGMKHAILDNYYGKIRRFADTWGSDWDGVVRADSIPEALKGLAALEPRDGSRTRT